MRIRKLELNGFKSFPDRTVVEFGPGISAVVGPNGSGKSNVLDAIRWVIGEQSARALRGGDMLDVIFAGSADRAAVSYAEVVLTLAADSGEPFPGEYARFSEVQIGRRLHRTGASEYFVNQARCRRRDVTDLFLDTGVATDLYCFIEQGSIGKIVHATPAERRVLIEEAAGISRYKARRDEAQGRLVETAAQLDRAADVAEEMGHRLRHLEGQVGRVARYRRLRAVVRQQEILLALARYADLTTERRRLRDAHRDTARRAEEEDRQSRRHLGEADARREEAAVVEAAAHTWRDEVAEQDARIRELEGALAFAARRSEEIGKARETALAEGGDLDERLRAAGVEKAAAEADVEALGRSVESWVAEAGRRAEALDVARAEATALRARIDDAEREAAAYASRHADLRARRDALVEAAGAGERERTEREHEAREHAVEHEGAVRAVDAARAGAAAIESTLVGLVEAVEASGVEVRAAREALVTAETALAALEEQRVGLLRDEARAGTGAEPATVDSLRSTQRRLVSDARARAEAWIAALDASAVAEVSRIASSAATEMAALGARLDAERAARAREADEALREATAAYGAQVRARVDVLEGAVREAIADRDAVRDRLAACDADRSRLARDRQVAEGRLAGLVERDRPEGGDDALAARPTLLALRHDAGVGVDEVAALGDRAALPVVTDEADIVAIAARTAGSRVRLAWSVRPVAPGEILPGTAIVSDLPEALAWHRRTGGAAAVRGTGERVGSDGVVTLGPGGAEARAAAVRRDEARALKAAVEALGRDVDALAAARPALAADLEAATARVETAATALRDGERSARSEADEGIRAVRAEHEGRAERARAVEASAREDLLARREAALATARDRAARARAEALANAGVAVDTVDAEGDAQLRAVIDAEVLRQGALRADRERSRQAVEERIAVARGVRDAAAARLRDADDTSRSATTRRATADVELAGAHGAIEAALARSTAVTVATEAAAAALRRLADEADRRGAALAAIDQDLAVLGSASSPALDLLRTARSEGEAHESVLREAFAAARVESATASERLNARRAAVDEAVRRLEELHLQARAHAQRLHDLGAASDANTAAAAQASVDVEAARSARASAWDRLVRDRERAAHLKEALRVLDEAARAHATARDAAAREAGDLDVRAREAQVEVEALRKRMEERYLVVLPALLDRIETHGRVVVETDEHARVDVEVGGRSYPGVPDREIRSAHLQDYDAIAALVEEVEEGKRQVAALGEVQLAAVDEYEDVRRRHLDLVAQRTDLEQATQRLREAIAKMNRTSRERFRETFDRVAENLERLYPRLTGGGRARLSLTNEEDLLETGVEIFVQPPGKRLQNLALLSGGEKAMTAIAVLLALFQVKPSPFCVLDEVDAPLDEVNGGRFNEMLREMAGLAQFILITHNRKTMEAADTLYGITMPTPGVSRLVSVRLSA